MENVNSDHAPDRDKDQFLSLFLANQRALYAMILSLVPNYSDADDVIQEVAMILWQKFDSFQHGSNFMAWAAQIVRYEVLRLRRRYATGHAFSDSLTNVIADRAIQFNQQADRRLAFLRSCLDELSDHQRELLQLRYGEDIRPRQIAQRRGESLASVYKMLTRTHQSLLNCIRRKRTLALEDVVD